MKSILIISFVAGYLGGWSAALTLAYILSGWQGG